MLQWHSLLFYFLQFLIDSAAWFSRLGLIDVHAQIMSDYARGTKLMPRRRYTEPMQATMQAIDRTGIVDGAQIERTNDKWLVSSCQLWIDVGSITF